MYNPNDIVLNRFKIIERISFGAFSLVYKAFDETKQQELCIKIEKIDEEEGESMIYHEYFVAQSFNSPFLCHSYDYFEDGSKNLKLYSMEILGDNLANTRRKRKLPPSIPMLMNVTIQCLKGLQVMHNKNFIHSDVKPSNFAFRVTGNDYMIVTFDFGLSQYDGESEEITAFRNRLVRNPRYLSLHTHETNQWRKNDDIYALIYSISDFWKDELPWDGRTTNNLVYQVKNGYDMKLLLPPELHILVDMKDEPVDNIITKLEEVSLKMKRNIEEEIHYICDPKDPGLKPKLIKYVFEENAKKKFTNQHSA